MDFVNLYFQHCEPEWYMPQQRTLTPRGHGECCHGRANCGSHCCLSFARRNMRSIEAPARGMLGPEQGARAHPCPPLPTRQPATDFRSRDCGAACTRRTSAAPPVSSVSYYARGEKKPFPAWCRNGICAALAVYLLLQVFLWQQTSSAC